tara:strand:+ start:1379 stop:1939 length:561 start_codon:yes stop_codon:yes gene_type:complete
MATVYDVIKGLSQAAANAYDGSHVDSLSSDGEARKVGLKREEGNPLIDSRVMDGFSVGFSGNKLRVGYHSEILMKQVHDKDFDTDIEQMFADIVKFLKKEYKKVTGSAVKLTPAGDADIITQNMSNIRSWVQAVKFYNIGGLTGVEDRQSSSPEDRLDNSIKKWLAMGKEKHPGAKKPKNVTRKGE